MANILGRNQLTGGGKLLLEVDADPSAGAGTPAPIGSMAFLSLAGVGSLWKKFGAANTDWSEITSGGASTAFRTIVGPVADTLTAADQTIFANNSAGVSTLQLPDPTTVGGKLFHILDSFGNLNTNPLTLLPFAAELINGLAANKDLQTNWGVWLLISDGTNWVVG